MWKKINTNKDIKSVEGDFPVYFSYTMGKAGTTFFTNLKNEGKLTGGKCKKCGKIYVPPRVYCEKCFEEIEDFIQLQPEGVLESWTIVKRDSYGNLLSEESIVGSVKILKSDGRIIHRLNLKKGVKPYAGMKVRAKLKPQKDRKGNLNDIEYFEPV